MSRGCFIVDHHMLVSCFGCSHWFFHIGIIQQLQKDLREHCTKTRASENFRPAPGTVCCSLFSGEAKAADLSEFLTKL